MSRVWLSEARPGVWGGGRWEGVAGERRVDGRVVLCEGKIRKGR